jgi:hypothetical protein
VPAPYGSAVERSADARCAQAPDLMADARSAPAAGPDDYSAQADSVPDARLAQVDFPELDDFPASGEFPGRDGFVVPHVQWPAEYSVDSQADSPPVDFALADFAPVESAAVDFAWVDSPPVDLASAGLTSADCRDDSQARLVDLRRGALL